MANSIVAVCNVSASIGGVTFPLSASITNVVAGDSATMNIQSIGTSNEALALGDVSAGGFLIIQNQDATNFVEISLDNAQAQVISKLLPGDWCKVSLKTVTVYAKADTAACNVAILACDA